MADIIEIKRQNKIQDVVQNWDEFKLNGRGRHWKGVTHNSFVVDIDNQLYFWNAQNRGGDVISFLQNEIRMEFKEALQYLARRAGIQLDYSPATAAKMRSARKRETVWELATQFFVNKRKNSEKANEWLTGRGWDEPILDKMKIGFWDGDYQGLKDWFKLHEVKLTEPAAVALIGYRGDVGRWFADHLPNEPAETNTISDWILKGKIPAILKREMIIYPHLEMGRVAYISARKLEVERDEHGNPKEGKSWNVRRELAGPRRPYWTPGGRNEQIIIVEGQADAVTLAKWNLPGVALAGTASSEDLVAQLGRYEHVFIATDGDAAGQKAATALIEAIGNTARVVRLPAGQDVNDLLQAGTDRAGFTEMLAAADTYPLFLCRLASEADFLTKPEAQKRAVMALAGLNRYEQAGVVKDAAFILKITQAQLKESLKAIREEEKRKAAAASIKTVAYRIGGYVDEHLYEMVYDPDERTTHFMVRWPDGRISKEDHLELSDVDIWPFPPTEQLIQDKTLLLPSKMEDYGSTESLVEAIRSHVYEFVDVPEEIERMCAYYILITWMADLLPVVPYLRALGETGSGKTRFIQTSGACAFRSVMASGKSSPAWMYRTMERYKLITLVLDEAEYSRQDENSDVINILNIGNRKEGFKMGRVISNAQNELEPGTFTTFGPKMFSQRKEFADAATNSRCWDWEANGLYPRDGIPTYLQDQFWGQALKIRNMCLAYRLRNWQPDITFDETLVDSRLPGRFKELILGALAVLPDIQDQLNEMAAAKLRQTIEDWSSRIEAKVLYGIIRCQYRPTHDQNIAAGAVKLACKHIADEANRIIDIENRLGDAEDDDGGKKKKLTARGIGHTVRTKFQMATERVAIGHKPRCVVWDEKRIESLCIRYGLERDLANLRAGDPDAFDRQN